MDYNIVFKYVFKYVYLNMGSEPTSINTNISIAFRSLFVNRKYP